MINITSVRLISLHVTNLLRGMVVMVGLFFMVSRIAMAETGNSVYMPMIFDSGQVIRTTACLQVTEHVYPPAWWEHFVGKTDTPEYALTAMILATKRKDKGALFELTEPTQRSDSKRFDNDVTQSFKWMETFEVVAIPSAYEVGNLFVFFVQIKQGERVNYLTYAFTHKNGGGFAFLPYGSEQLSYVIVSDWLNSMWGPAKTDKPEYCTDENIKNATHRIPLSSLDNAKSVFPPSYLFFKGASLNEPNAPTSKLARQIQSTIEEIKSEIKSPDHKRLDEFIKHLTSDGGKGLKEWFASANQSELSSYKKAITEQFPIFFIDALPLVVVYAKSQGGSLQVMFFISNANNELLWTHTSHISNSTKIFTKGPLRDAALEAKPFANSLIK